MQQYLKAKNNRGRLKQFFLIMFFVFLSVNILADSIIHQVANSNEMSSNNLVSYNVSENSAVTRVNKDAQIVSVAPAFFEDASYEKFGQQKDSAVFYKDQVGSLKNNENINIDPGVVTLIQSVFLEKIKNAFSVVADFALALLYYFAAFEFVIFGLGWAMQNDAAWGRLFFKIIRIGVILFIICNYTWLLDSIMQSFARIAGVVLNGDAAAKYILNPAKIWQYGYDVGIHLLKLASSSINFGVVMVQVVLGMGILLVFGLLGIQMIVQMVSFYFVSLGALVLLPFGAFTLSRKMFDRAVQSVLQAGIRLMSLIIIIGAAVVIWDGFKLIDVAIVSRFNVNQFLGLFFTGLLFLCLAIYLPNILSQAVGHISSGALDFNVQPVAMEHGSDTAAVIATGEISGIKAATTIETVGAAATLGGYSAVAGSRGDFAGVAVGVTPTSIVITPGGARMDAKISKEVLAQASNLSKSITESTVQRIKEAVTQAVKEKK